MPTEFPTLELLEAIAANPALPVCERYLARDEARWMRIRVTALKMKPVLDKTRGRVNQKRKGTGVEPHLDVEEAALLVFLARVGMAHLTLAHSDVDAEIARAAQEMHSS